MFPGHIAQSTPDKLAVVMAQSGFTYTYKELDDAANRFSQALANHGLKPGDHWCVCAGRWLEAYEDGMAPPVRLEACEQSALEVIPLELLQEHASAAA